MLAGVLAASALIGAVLVPDEAPGWLRERFHLGEGNETATTPWVRWVLVGVAAALLVLPRIWGRPIWAEALIASFVFLAVYAGVKEHHRAAKVLPETDPSTTSFILPAEKVQVAGSGSDGRGALKAGSVVLVVVEPDKVVDGRPFTYSSTRYKATTSSELSAEKQTDSVLVRIERGPDDATAVSFAADLVGAERIYVLGP